MIHRTILTSKGTTTIPREIRDELGVKPGMLIAFSKNENTGEFILSRAQTIAEVRAANKKALRAVGTGGKHYVSGAGYSAHVAEGLR